MIEKVRVKILGFFVFALTIALLIVVLKLMNWLPMVIQEGSIKEYSSIEEVRSKLNIKNIYTPLYFPQIFIWPPSKILAQNRPYAAIILEFKSTEGKDIGLIISQAASKHFTYNEKIKIEVKNKTDYDLKGRDAELETGFCRDKVPCSRISWNERDRKLQIIAKTTHQELVKIAESMLPR